MYNAKLLIVDDDRIIRKTLMKLLSISDYSLYEAENGLKALEIIKQYKPEIIITDINMPLMNGIELIKKINSEESYYYKIIVLSSQSDYQEIEACFNEGVSGFYQKPFNKYVLRGMVRNQLDILDYQKNLRFKNKLEEIITQISSRFINAKSEQIEDLIIFALQEISTFLNTELSYFFTKPLNQAANIYNNTLADQEIFADIKIVVESIINSEPDSSDFIVYDDSQISDKYPETHKFIKNHDLKSLAIIPISYSKKVVSYLVFISKENYRIWKNDSLLLLKTAGEIIYNALVKKESEEEKKKLQEVLIKRKEMDTFHALVITANHEINQPLTVLSGNLELLEIMLKEKTSEKVTHSIKSAQTAAGKISKILKKLRSIEKPEYIDYYKKRMMININFTDEEEND